MRGASACGSSIEQGTEHPPRSHKTDESLKFARPSISSKARKNEASLTTAQLTVCYSAPHSQTTKKAKSHFFVIKPKGPICRPIW